MLLNGHHRLEASKAGAEFSSFVDFDRPDDEFKLYDTGQSRNYADIHSIEGKVKGDVTRNKQSSEICGFIASRVLGVSGTSLLAEKVSQLHDIYKDELVDLFETSKVHQKGLTTASVKAAFIMRLHDATENERAMLLEQWKGFSTCEGAKWDQTTNALVRRLNNAGADTGSTKQIEVGALGWMAWNPKTRNLTKLVQKKKTSDVMKEMREIVLRHEADSALFSFSPVRRLTKAPVPA